MSTVLGPTVEFAFIAGNVVTTRSAAVPGAVGLVLMAVLGALLVDGPHGLLDRTASLSPRPTNRDRPGNDDGPGGSEERPEDRRGHEGRPVTQTTKQSMHQLLFSSPSRGHSGGPADAKIISAHHGKTDHAANGLRTRVDQGPQLGRALTGSSFGDPYLRRIQGRRVGSVVVTVSYTHLRAHETD